MFSDGPEYVARTQAPFVPGDIDLQRIRDAIPKHAFERSTPKALAGIAPVVAASIILFAAAFHIARLPFDAVLPSPALAAAARTAVWVGYWVVQGICWAGLWTVGHEADHNNLSRSLPLNHAIGFVCHSWLFLPYLSWRITHLRHHKHTNSIEHDEVYIPTLRSEYRLPSAREATRAQYMEALEESPIVTCVRFLTMQLLGMHIYLTLNSTGSKRYPPGANHWVPSSGLFTNAQQNDVMLSNVGIFAMIAMLVYWARQSSVTEVLNIYFIPFLLSNHWIVTMTFLQHSDPTVPFYRGDAWSKTRGALSTIDRPMLGWVGEVFFLGLNHYHTTHHLFTTIPFYNLRTAHDAIRPLLGDMYNYDSTGTFRALYRSWKECVFVEDEGGILFFRDQTGTAKREAKVAL